MKVRRFVALLAAMILTTGVAANVFAAPAAAGTIGGPEVAWSTTTGGDKDCWERSGDNAISSTDKSGKDECHPLITIAKTADPEALPVGGGEVTYTYVVSNDGNVPVKNVAVTDDKCALVKGGHDGELKPGKSWTYTCTTTITQTTTNVGTATADWVDCSNHDGPDRVVETNNDGGPKCHTKAVTPATDEATVTVPVANPRIYVEKKTSVTELPAGGGEVTFTYVVTNIGNVPLSGVTLVDDKCDAVSAPTGDTNADSKLDLTETWTYTCTMTLTATTTNLATATGHYGDDTTIDAAEKTVTVTSRLNHPQIYLLKTPSVTELPAGGGPVTFTYLVWNTGNAPLTDVSLVDDKCSAVTGPTGDTGADEILGLDETWTYLCTMTLTATTTNIGTATGYAGDYKSIDADDVIVTVAASGGGVEAATDTPTGPPTDTLTSTTTDLGGGFPLLLLILGVLGFGALALTPVRAKR